MKTDESINIRYKIDNSEAKVGIDCIHGTLSRKLVLWTKGTHSIEKESAPIKISLTGWEAGGKIDEQLFKI